MPAARLPCDEADRLQALHDSGLLDRQPDPRVTTITRLASVLTERPVAALSLVAADEQVFRPAIGLAMSSTSRDLSFCAHAILDPDRPLVVDDAREDPRFVDNALVTGEMGLRCYAGVPVRAHNGQPLGALCVLDQAPGPLSPMHIGVLTSLAKELENVVGKTKANSSAVVSRTRKALLHDLRIATRVGAFHLHWQPVARASDLHVGHYEVLSRWNRLGHGPVPPDQFIPIAEASGLIRQIDSFVLQAACAAAAGWTQAHRISVNISPNWFSLARPALPELVRRVLASTGLAPARLTLELTERMLVETRDRALSEMQCLIALGVGIALDDFGAGHSSMTYLEAFPFKAVKLDRALVRGLADNTRAQAIVRAMVDLGHELNLSVCAEGIETESQLRFVRQAGCDMVQGYLIGRPEPLIACVRGRDQRRTSGSAGGSHFDLRRGHAKPTNVVRGQESGKP